MRSCICFIHHVVMFLWFPSCLRRFLWTTNFYLLICIHISKCVCILLFIQYFPFSLLSNIIYELISWVIALGRSYFAANSHNSPSLPSQSIFRIHPSLHFDHFPFVFFALFTLLLQPTSSLAVLFFPS